MRSSQRLKLAVLAASTLLFKHAHAQTGDCAEGPYNTAPVGYPTGGEWCATKWKQGAAINGIQAWYNGDSINGIEFQYTNGAPPEKFGAQIGDRKEWLTWDTTADTVESITTWPNGRSDVLRVAAIEIKLAGKDPWRAGFPPQNTKSYSTPVVKGSGIIMGAFGRQGGSIDMIGFMMLESGITGRKLRDFKPLDESMAANNDNLKGAKPKALMDFTQENWTSSPQEYVKIDSREVWKNSTIERSNSRMFANTVGASVDFGIPSIGIGGSINTEFHWETAESTSTSESNSVKETYYLKVKGNIPSGEAIYCEALTYSGNYSIAFGSTIDLELQSGKRWTYQEFGTVKGTTWASNENKCITYKKGQVGKEVMQRKLEEWKKDPAKEQAEDAEREKRVEDQKKKKQGSEKKKDEEKPKEGDENEEKKKPEEEQDPESPDEEEGPMIPEEEDPQSPEEENPTSPDEEDPENPEEEGPTDPGEELAPEDPEEKLAPEAPEVPEEEPQPNEGETKEEKASERKNKRRIQEVTAASVRQMKGRRSVAFTA